MPYVSLHFCNHHPLPPGPRAEDEVPRPGATADEGPRRPATGTAAPVSV